VQGCLSSGEKKRIRALLGSANVFDLVVKYKCQGLSEAGISNLRLDSYPWLDMMKFVFTLHPAGERSRLPA
jgi:hypothetical protein